MALASSTVLAYLAKPWVRFAAQTRGHAYQSPSSHPTGAHHWPPRCRRDGAIRGEACGAARGHTGPRGRDPRRTPRAGDESTGLGLGLRSVLPRADRPGRRPRARLSRDRGRPGRMGRAHERRSLAEGRGAEGGPPVPGSGRSRRVDGAGRGGPVGAVPRAWLLVWHGVVRPDGRVERGSPARGPTRPTVVSRGPPSTGCGQVDLGGPLRPRPDRRARRKR